MEDVRIDRDALRDIVARLRVPDEASDWCVACGAGAASAKLDFPQELINEAGRQLLDPSALRSFAAELKNIGEDAAWCVACGAGAAASPLDLKGNPADLPDAVINEIADKLLGAIRLGK